MAYRSWKRAWAGHLALARISNSPTVISNTLAGAALASGQWLDGRLALVTLAMVLFYTAGMYLNDLCDYTLDCSERPERPLPQGLVSRQQACTIMILLFTGGSALLWGVGPESFLSGLLLIALIILYDRWHKQNPFSPLCMALCRILVYITAFLAYTTVVSTSLIVLCGLLLLYVVGLTMIAKVERIPQMISRSSLAMLLAPVLYFMFMAPTGVALLFALLFSSWMSYSIFLIYHGTTRQTRHSVAYLIAGIALFDGNVLVRAGNLWGALLALSAFGLTLYLQRYVRGT